MQYKNQKNLKIKQKNSPSRRRANLTLRRMRQGLMLEVAQSHGNEIESVEIHQNKCDVHDKIRRVGQPKHALHVVAGQEIQGIFFYLEKVNFNKRIEEHQSKHGKLVACLSAALALVAEVGLAQGDHADGADKEKGVRCDRLHGFEQIGAVVEANHRIGEKNECTQKGRHGRGIVEIATLEHGGHHGQPAGDGAPGAGQQHIQHGVQIQIVAAREIEDSACNFKQYNQCRQVANDAVALLRVFAAAHRDAQDDGNAKKNGGDVDNPKSTVDSRSCGRINAEDPIVKRNSHAKCLLFLDASIIR